MGKKTNKGDIIVSIKGSEETFHIRKNTVYTVIGRSDAGAPEALQKYGSSKIPFAGNCDYVNCPFDRIGNIYDTGFYPESRCYNDLTREAAAESAEMALKNVGEPYSRVNNVDISQYNYEFWDSLSIKLYEGGLVFDTNNPTQLFNLYISILSGQLCPDVLDGDPKFMNAFYMLIDSSVNLVQGDEYELNVLDATTNFMSLFKGSEEQRQTAIDIAIYLKIHDGMDADDRYFAVAFKRFLEERVENIERFKYAYDLSKDPTKHEILKMSRMLTMLMSRGRVRTDKEGLYLKGVLLGKEKQVISETVVMDPKQAKSKMLIIEEYEKIYNNQESE